MSCDSTLFGCRRDRVTRVVSLARHGPFDVDALYMLSSSLPFLSTLPQTLQKSLQFKLFYFSSDFLLLILRTRPFIHSLVRPFSHSQLFRFFVVHTLRKAL